MSRWLVAAVLAVALSACVQSGAGSSAYDLSEFDVDGPTGLSTGASTVTVRNSGEFPHTLVIVGPDGSVVFATDMIQPGETVEMDVDLTGGTYQFSCRIVGQKPDGTIVDHFEEGMVQTVSVGS